jgi:hypothetical protein
VLQVCNGSIGDGRNDRGRGENPGLVDGCDLLTAEEVEDVRTHLQPEVLPVGNPSANLNPNFGHATPYQSPRNFRLLARFSF